MLAVDQDGVGRGVTYPELFGHRKLGKCGAIGLSIRHHKIPSLSSGAGQGGPSEDHLPARGTKRSRSAQLQIALNAQPIPQANGKHL